MKIFDVGMYDGADTAYYLRHAHTVVAIEANPELCENAKQKFSAAIRSGTLVILNVAIGSDKWVDLTISREDLGSSSIYAERIAHRSPGSSYRVRATTLPELIREHGQPDFIKIDIEGADRECVLSLSQEIAPEYVSFEAPHEITELITHLSSIGYSRFKAIQQTCFRSLRRQELIRDRIMRKFIRLMGYDEPRCAWRHGESFVLGHSAGPAPWESDGRFHHAQRMIAEWESAKAHGLLSGWYDIHVAR